MEKVFNALKKATELRTEIAKKEASFWEQVTIALDEYPNLAAYVTRAEARPAYRRAFEAQLVVFNSK